MQVKLQRTNIKGMQDWLFSPEQRKRRATFFIWINERRATWFLIILHSGSKRNSKLRMRPCAFRFNA